MDEQERRTLVKKAQDASPCFHCESHSCHLAKYVLERYGTEVERKRWKNDRIRRYGKAGA